MKKIKNVAPRSLSFFIVVAFVLGISSSLLPALASATPANVAYDNIPSPAPGNLVSQAFEAQSASEFGGQVQFAVGSGLYNPKVTVMLSSWGCENGNWYSDTCVTSHDAKFSHPITLNIYNVGGSNTVGSLLATKTQTFNIPYRPSADNIHCVGPNGADGYTGDGPNGEWYSSKDKKCYNGLATPISFKFSNVTLPDKAIISLAYNTTHYGYQPIGDNAACFSTSGGCGYDSLNVALTAPPTVGSLPAPDAAYINSSWLGAYCDGGATTGTFRLDTGPPGCWTDYQPAIQVETSAKQHLKLAKKDIENKQCDINGANQLVDAHYKVLNDSDSGFNNSNYWANDTVDRHVRIWQETDTTYCVRVSDHGKFVTYPGTSPGGSSTVTAGVKGELEGGYITTNIVGVFDQSIQSHGDLGTFDCQGTQTDQCPNDAHVFNWTKYFSTITSSNDFAQWGWIYHAGHNGTWLNQDDVPAASSGDITG